MPNYTDKIILPKRSTGEAIANTLAMIGYAEAGNIPAIDSWDLVQRAVRNGLAASWFPVGTQFVTTHDTYGNLVWDVVAHDNDVDPLGVQPHTMTLLLNRYIPSIQYDAVEALYYCNEELPAGTYNFTLLAGYDEEYGGGLTYQFTTASAVPALGCIMFPWGYNVQASTVLISTYATRSSTSAIESVAVTVGSGGTSLGTADGNTTYMNHAHRIRYGSSNWEESAVRQYLNSAGAAGTYWTPQTYFDRPPVANSTLNGFQNGLEADFVAILGEVDKVSARNTVNEGGSYDTTRDLFYLPSMTEIYGTQNNSISEGTAYTYYVGTENNDKIKYPYNSTTASYW